ncbi:YcxB family protein [Microcoleus sp. FACHB-1515]|uniref:YcxB family protein n=1 Tax=Cyanophyceae TaxID=3028117 RepID=UPI001684274E|nr:YcxB family protein [Microcoleus sp. FACHB-1515]MBD2090526.1 YcxB family protein [Microcoleus sp. FACHB-1515]
MLKLEYRLTQQDYLEANFANLRANRVLYLLLWFISGLFLLFGIFLFVVAIINGDFALPSLLYCCVFMIFTNPEPQINLFMRWMYGLIWKQNAHMHNPIAAEVTEAGLSLDTLNISSQVNWQSLIKFMETPNLFVIYQSPQLFYPLPKRSFANAAQIDEFRSLLQTHIRAR